MSPPIGYRWRSSKWFILATVAIALFAETFLYGFFVPLLGYMFQVRLHVDVSQTQWLTSTLLALHGAVSVISGPFIGHFCDKTSGRKLPLLLSLGACALGTAMIAATYSVPTLFIGRLIQGVAGTAVWILGFATVTDAVGQEKMGTTIGTMAFFVNLGRISGPAVSGMLLEVAGYWATWSIPFLVLAVDLVARVFMIERSSATSSEPTKDPSETTTLLSPSEDSQPPFPSAGLWRIMLRDSRVLTALFISMLNTSLATSFHATLPAHVQATFGWGSGPAGMLFSCLVLPGLVLSPFAGWLRDRVGVQYPALVSCILHAVLLGLLGMAGNDRFAWASIDQRGKILYTGCIVSIGAVRPFIGAVGAQELIATVTAHQEKNPGIFGPKGGISRVLSIVEVTASLGTIIGPIIGGSLQELVGYAFMCWNWSILYTIVAVLVICFLGPRGHEETY